ncbi:Uncharacterised protein [Mycobacteroides abscessus subsp. abscessus]|nr:Uncharacterised protein [Mycobacteroides abscessus subsp. abscessus]SKV05603.1 Uncharacterised protein [Mycobacteroides abscessus subsp. abscessus]
MSCTRVNLSMPVHAASVTSPSGLPSSSTTAAPCERLWISAIASPAESSGARVTGVS